MLTWSLCWCKCIFAIHIENWNKCPMDPNSKMQKSRQLIQSGVAVPLFHLSKMEEFGIKDVSVYINIELQDKLLDINLWEGNIFKIPSCSCESKPKGPAEPWKVVLVDGCCSKGKVKYKAEECLPLGKADNVITLFCNQGDLHAVGSKLYSRQIIAPRTTLASIFTKSELFV